MSPRIIDIPLSAVIVCISGRDQGPPGMFCAAQRASSAACCSRLLRGQGTLAVPKVGHKKTPDDAGVLIAALQNQISISRRCHHRRTCNSDRPWRSARRHRIAGEMEHPRESYLPYKAPVQRRQAPARDPRWQEPQVHHVPCPGARFSADFGRCPGVTLRRVGRSPGRAQRGWRNGPKDHLAGAAMSIYA
jgi:hypothetical protein